jgi:hypothetical protein
MRPTGLHHPDRADARPGDMLISTGTMWLYGSEVESESGHTYAKEIIKGSVLLVVAYPSKPPQWRGAPRDYFVYSSNRNQFGWLMCNEMSVDIVRPT